MQSVRLGLTTALLGLALAGCDRQPNVVRTSGATDNQLSEVAANTGEMDGLGTANALMAPPNFSQRLQAARRPPANEDGRD